MGATYIGMPFFLCVVYFFFLIGCGWVSFLAYLLSFSFY
uniref:Uncharacterized protein n=1 Tax=Rhizophora mucronata TaxID=61149 RepID=A0A2P2QL45_RHIMU